MNFTSLFSKVREHKHITLLFSLILSFLFTQGSRIHFSGNVAAGMKKNYITPWTPKCFCLFFFSFFVIFCVLSLLFIWMEHHACKEKKALSRKSLLLWLLVGTLLLLLCWCPYLLSYYPGSVLADSLVSIRQALAERITSNHYPAAYSLFVGLFVKLGLFLGNINTGVFLYSITQSILMALTLSFTLYWLYQKGICKPLLFVFFLFYAIMPFFPAYAIIMWKDPLYSCALLLLMILLFEVIQSTGTLLSSPKIITIFVLLFGIISFFRNNGIYTVILCCLFLFLYFRRNILTALFFFTCFVFLYFIITVPVYHHLGIESEFVESLGIPLQQLGYTITENGELTPSEEEFLFTLLPEKNWKKDYRPCIVDTIKWDSEFNSVFLEENKIQFLKVWASVLVKNFDSYVNAYCLETFGFWKPCVQNSYGYVDTYISDNELSIVPTDMFQQLFEISIQEKLTLFRPMLGSGTLLWVFLFCLYLCIIQTPKSSLILLPAFANWLVILLATPVAFSLRYVYIFALALPFALCLPFLVNKERITKA